MSRTDKTQPWKIKAFFYSQWVEEQHNHENGECNLPARPSVNNVGYGSWRSSDCHWTFSQEFRNSRMARCGCPICRIDAFEGKGPKKKQQRRQGRKYARGGWRDEY